MLGVTAFTGFELLRENQLVEENYPPPPPRLGLNICLDFFVM